MLQCKHCCGGNVIIVKCSECVSVALFIQHATRIGHAVICGLSGYRIFFHIISKTARLKKYITKCKACVLIGLQYLWEKFLVLRRIQRYIINEHRSSCENTSHRLIIIIRNLSNDRSKACSKTIPPSRASSFN